ncbi:unnamed protein product [Leuciscus chuanchicus]
MQQQLQPSNRNSADLPGANTTPTPTDRLLSSPGLSTSEPPRMPLDLGEDKPNQVKLRRYPLRLCGNQQRSFVASWFTSREWLEYSVEADAAFCFSCRKHLISSSDSAFTVKGFSHWKHAVEAGKGLNKHAASKEHMTSMALWKEREKRTESGQEISTLFNSNQLARHRYYLSSIVDMVEFLVVNHLPLRGSTDAFDSLTEGGSGLFLSLFEYTLRKDPELWSVVQTIPRNATYTSHNIQNDVIANMSSLVTEEIVREVADSWYTIKVDGTHITELLAQINGNRRYETEVRMEAVGLIKEVSETSFKFIAHMVYKILQLLDAPNKLMQSEDMDLLSAVKLVTCASECLAKLRCESDFLELWEKADDNEMPKPSKRKRTINKGLQEYLLEESIGQA